VTTSNQEKREVPFFHWRTRQVDGFAGSLRPKRLVSDCGFVRKWRLWRFSDRKTQCGSM